MLWVDPGIAILWGLAVATAYYTLKPGPVFTQSTDLTIKILYRRSI